MDTEYVLAAATRLKERAPKVVLEWGFRPEFLPQVRVPSPRMSAATPIVRRGKRARGLAAGSDRGRCTQPAIDNSRAARGKEDTFAMRKGRRGSLCGG